MRAKVKAYTHPGGERSLQNRGLWMLPYIFLLFVYGPATWLTRTHFMADTPEYVDSIQAYAHGEDHYFWDFGHLLWRPLGWVGFRTLRPLSSIMCAADERCNITVALVGISWVTGLLSVYFLYAFVSGICNREWPPVLAAIGFIFSQAFLNFTHTGAAYIPGLCLLLFGLFISMDAWVLLETSSTESVFGRRCVSGGCLSLVLVRSGVIPPP